MTNIVNQTSVQIKIKSLAAEARIIRHAEQRRRKQTIRGHRKVADDVVFWSLRNHRKIDVRNEARAALLAYGFMRGRPYLVMEAKYHEAPNWTRVAQILIKYADPSTLPERTRGEMAQVVHTNKVLTVLSEWSKPLPKAPNPEVPFHNVYQDDQRVKAEVVKAIAQIAAGDFDILPDNPEA